MNLTSFLGKYRCGKEDGPNWGSLLGGRYKIPKDKKATFFKLVSSAAPGWDGKKNNFGREVRKLCQNDVKNGGRLEINGAEMMQRLCQNHPKMIPK